MKNFLALYTSIMNTVFFSFRFSDFVIGLPPASVKREEDDDDDESRIIYVTCCLSGFRMENHAS